MNHTSRCGHKNVTLVCACVCVFRRVDCFVAAVGGGCRKLCLREELRQTFPSPLAGFLLLSTSCDATGVLALVPIKNRAYFPDCPFARGRNDAPWALLPQASEGSQAPLVLFYKSLLSALPLPFSLPVDVRSVERKLFFGVGLDFFLSPADVDLRQ